MNPKLITIFFGFFALFMIGCEKEKPVLPLQPLPKFECNINLNEWYPQTMYVNAKGPEWKEFYAYDSEYAMTILVDDSTEFLAKHEFISSFNRATVTVKATQEKYSTFTTPALNAGHVEITSIDSVKNTLSGNFAFTAYGSGGKSIVVRYGILKNVPFIE